MHEMQKFNSVDQLVNMYYKSVGRNSTLILGLTPDPQGLMPEGDVARLKEFGDEINKRFSVPLATTSGKSYELILNLVKKQSINHIIIQEDIKSGERVRLYRIEAYIKGKWQTICEGESIGHKRIQQFDKVNTNKIRLTIIKSVAQPNIKSFSAFFTK